ncbi:VanZ family protein [Enterococcus sp. BWT-B8]|uniref:VanZ family protein n=1 Tax=Enterococcus sp. BWT-B8 TaxID=2885157 RepID=UPI001E29C176|nr:VanZ family protein [Enterococcus sp. BWT-B8]MCB5951088.1 VanZ family protein [Enterococcus sp. BWT-B8]
MYIYAGPIRTALIIFPFLAFAISFIFIIYEYRKYGTFLFWRALILYSFVFYVLCAYFLVILPLPPREEVAHYTSQIIELRPFYTVVRFFTETTLVLGDPNTYIPAMKQGVVLEPLFNIVLLVPLGIYLRYYFKFSFKKVVLTGFLLSLFFELTQLSGLYFIYPRSYRLADVNDLINNTLGSMIGYAITPLFTFLLPSREEIDEEAYRKGAQVTVFRRLSAFAIDWFLIGIVQAIITTVPRFSSQYRMWDDQVHLSDNRIWFFPIVLIVFMLIPTFTNGQTMGKKIVKIRIVEEGKAKISFQALFLRYGYLYYIFQLSSIYASYADVWLNSANPILQAVSLILFIFSLIIILMFIFSIGYSILKKQRQFFYERASHTYTVSTITPNKKFEKSTEEV